MKTIILALIVWHSGASDVYEIATKSECVDLTRKLAPYVQSANCASFADYSSAPYIAPELALDYFPPEE